MKDKTTQNGVNGSIDQSVYFAMRRTGKVFMFTIIASLVLGFTALVASIVIVAMGKGKDKVVVLNSEGRPAMVMTDNPDRIYGPELDVFARDVIPVVFDWDYVEAQSAEGFNKRMQTISRYFDYKFLNDFAGPLKNIYLGSVVNQRSVIRTRLAEFRDVKIEGGKATLSLVVAMRTIKVGEQQAVGENNQMKNYILKVKKGVRTIENPFGLYVDYLTESVTGNQ